MDGREGAIGRLPPLTGGYRRVVLLVLDGVGIGAAGDSSDAGGASGGPAGALDPGADTFGSVWRHASGLRLPNLDALGLGGLLGLPLGAGRDAPPTGTSARLFPLSRGRDTLIGHWELTGLVTDLDLRTFPAGIPAELLAAIEAATGMGLLGGEPASGTEIISRLGDEHRRTGRPIIYTSADSVLQLAAHTSVIDVQRLYELCAVVRQVAQGPWLVGRVIARPFEGGQGAYRRTGGRRDFALRPPAPTVLDAALAAQIEVVGIGKIGDVFAGQGISRAEPASGNAAIAARLAEVLQAGPPAGQRQLVLANFNDFDTLYGHRRDPDGFAAALVHLDGVLGPLVAGLGTGGLLIVTADHGCDPTYRGTDHTRETVPLLLVGTGWPPACLGTLRGLNAVAGLVSAAFGLEGFRFWPRNSSLET